MSIRDSMSDPRFIRAINCGILDGLRLRDGLALAHVLLVESDPEIRAHLGDTLRRAGYRVSTARDLEESLQTARCDGPELILVNIVLAKRDGLGVVAALRARAEATKIAAYSSDDRFTWHLDAALTFGADDIVEEPSDPANLLAVVRDLLELPNDRQPVRPRRPARAAG